MSHSQDIINECWRSIDGTINYQVSNTGKVRNVSSGLELSDRSYNGEGYAIVRLRINSQLKSCKIHQLVANCFIPKPESDERLEVDHISQDKTNNNVSNLMWKTSRQNKWNRNKINKTTSSRYIGVSFQKRQRKWRATIRLNDGCWKHIGTFHDEKDAARAYNAKAYELRGNFAVLNDISADED